MIEQDLTIYISGPDPKDTKVFIGNYRVSLLQKFSLNINSESFLPRIDMSFPAINLTYQEELPKTNNDTVVITLNKTVCELDGSIQAAVSTNIKVSVGDNIIGGLSSIKLEVGVGRPTVLELRTSLLEGPPIPSWVNMNWVDVRKV